MYQYQNKYCSFNNSMDIFPNVLQDKLRFSCNKEAFKKAECSSLKVRGYCMSHENYFKQLLTPFFTCGLIIIQCITMHCAYLPDSKYETLMNFEHLIVRYGQNLASVFSSQLNHDRFNLFFHYQNKLPNNRSLIACT